MLGALCEHPAQKSSLYIQEMAIFLRDEFNILPSSCSINELFPGLLGRKSKPRK
jgi:hypothetical protein